MGTLKDLFEAYNLREEPAVTLDVSKLEDVQVLGLDMPS